MKRLKYFEVASPQWNHKDVKGRSLILFDGEHDLVTSPVEKIYKENGKLYGIETRNSLYLNKNLRRIREYDERGKVQTGFPVDIRIDDAWYRTSDVEYQASDNKDWEFIYTKNSLYVWRNNL